MGLACHKTARSRRKLDGGREPNQREPKGGREPKQREQNTMLELRCVVSTGESPPLARVQMEAVVPAQGLPNARLFGDSSH